MELNFETAIQAIRAKKPNIETIASALRDLDEPRTRLMAELLLLVVEVEKETRNIIEETAGHAERSAKASRTLAQLWMVAPTTAAEAEELADAVYRHEDILRQAMIDGSRHQVAERTLAGIHSIFARLFDKPIQSFKRDPLWMLGARLGNRIAELRQADPDLVLVLRDGWVWTSHPAPPNQITTLETIEPLRRLS